MKVNAEETRTAWASFAQIAYPVYPELKNSDTFSNYQLFNIVHLACFIMKFNESYQFNVPK